jgi:hypothetical protein
MAKKFKTFDSFMGKYRTFKSGQKVLYLSSYLGVITENGTVLLDKGSELPLVLSEQPHKLRKVKILNTKKWH